MVRIMMVTFAVLGWSWYELSGGNEFVPGGEGLSVVAEVEGPSPLAEPQATGLAGLQPLHASMVVPAPTARETVSRDRLNGEVTRIDTTKAFAKPVDEIALVLASATPAADGSFDPTAPMQRIAGLGTSLPLGTKMGAAVAPAFVAATPDLRVVSGSRVNLRDGPATSYSVVTKLSEGDAVEVLIDTGDGWVKLRVVQADTVGWMSDDFLIASN